MTAYELMMQAQAEDQQKQAPAPASAPAPIQTPAPAPVQITSCPMQTKAQVDEVLSRAMLVAFACSIPGNEKVDRKTTEEVKSAKGMGKQSGKWDKTVFPPARYKRLKTVADAMRSWHYANTFSWPMPGVQLLPTMKHAAYCEGMRGWKRQLETARDEFLADLPKMVEWAKVEHNGSFDPSLYDEQKIRERFGWGVDFWPIPAADHFAKEMREALGADASAVDEKVANALASAENELWERLLTPLQNIQSILAKKDSGDRTRITESLLENILEIAKQAPSMNLGGNPKIDAFAKEAEAAFSQFSTKELKDDEMKRAEALKASSDILRRMTGIVA